MSRGEASLTQADAPGISAGWQFALMVNGVPLRLHSRTPRHGAAIRILPLGVAPGAPHSKPSSRSTLAKGCARVPRCRTVARSVPRLAVHEPTP